MAGAASAHLGPSPWRILAVPVGLSPEDAASRLESLHAAWAGRAPLALQAVPPEELSRRFAAEVETGARAAIALGPRALVRRIAPSLMAMAEEAGLGVLFVLDDPGPAMPVASAQHAVELTGDAGAPVIAGALLALAHLNPALRQNLEEQRLETQVRSVACRQFDEAQLEQHLAVMVQREFLPRARPSTPGMDTGVLFRPKSGLSGDFYDIARLDEHHTAFFMADACGHGVPAALLMMLMSKLLPMKEINGSSYRIIEPAEALTRLNARFAERKGDVHALVSAAYGVIDGRDGTVRLASAGHPPAVVLSRGGAAPIDQGGPLLGAFEDLIYEQTTLQLAPGDLLLVHSDGVPPALGLIETDALSAAPVIADLRDAAGQHSLEAALDRFAGAIDARAGSLHQQDDVTMLMIRRLPLCARAGLAA